MAKTQADVNAAHERLTVASSARRVAQRAARVDRKFLADEIVACDARIEAASEKSRVSDKAWREALAVEHGAEDEYEATLVEFEPPQAPEEGAEVSPVEGEDGTPETES